MRSRLKKRLRMLWILELVNAVLVFPLLYAFIAQRFRLGWFSLVALVAVCANLLVGASFWYLKARAIEGCDTLRRPGAHRFYRISKRVFGALIPVLLALYLGHALTGGPSWAELLLGAAFGLMAVLEYVNYYHVQLMYDNRADLEYLLAHRRVKRAIMVRELGI